METFTVYYHQIKYDKEHWDVASVLTCCSPCPGPGQPSPTSSGTELHQMPPPTHCQSDQPSHKHTHKHTVIRPYSNITTAYALHFFSVTSFEQHWQSVYSVWIWEQLISAFLALIRRGRNEDRMNITRISLWESLSLLKWIMIMNPNPFSQQCISLAWSVLFHEAHSKLPWHVGQRETLLIHRYFRYWTLRLELIPETWDHCSLQHHCLLMQLKLV